MRRTALHPSPIRAAARLLAVLALVAAPATAQVELGHDVRYSDVGTDGDTSAAAARSDVCFDPLRNRYLVSFQAEQAGPSSLDPDRALFGVLVDGDTGLPLAVQDTLLALDATRGHDVVHIPERDEFVVAWAQLELSPAGFDSRVWARRFAAADLTPLGPAVALQPDVAGTEFADVVLARDAAAGELLLACEAFDLDDTWIRAERFADDLTGPGSGALNLLTPFVPGGAESGSDPDVASGPPGGPDLVAWVHRTASVLGTTYDVRARRLQGGRLLGDELDLTSGLELTSLRRPALALDEATGTWLVLGAGVQDGLPLAFARRVDAASGAVLGAADGPLSLGGLRPLDVDLAWNPVSGEHLAVFSGYAEPSGPSEVETWALRLSTSGQPLAAPVRLSDMGPDGDPAYDASEPALAWNPLRDELLVTWTGDDDSGGLVDGEFEIHGQRVAATAECFLVIGSGTGADSFGPELHTWTTQVGTVLNGYPVLLDDIPTFVLPPPGLPDLSGQALPAGGAAAPLTAPQAWLTEPFSVQVVMWNPAVFPDLPEQVSHGLAVRLRPGGQVQALPFGAGTGMTVSVESETGPSGELLLRFPFTIPGM